MFTNSFINLLHTHTYTRTCKATKQAQDVKTTLYECCYNVTKVKQCCSNVILTTCAGWDANHETKANKHIHYFAIFPHSSFLGFYSATWFKNFLLRLLYSYIYRYHPPTSLMNEWLVDWLGNSFLCKKHLSHAASQHHLLRNGRYV